MEYKIKSFDPSFGSIVVEFNGQYEYNIDIPIVDDQYITGEELHSYILGFFPHFVIDRKNKIANGISNEADIRALVVATDNVAEDDPATTQVVLAVYEELQKAKIIALINTVLDEREASNV